jgi:hypothetical protein
VILAFSQFYRKPSLGPPTGIGTLVLMFVIVGGGTGTGTTGLIGVDGIEGVCGFADVGGASADMLFVRNATLLSRAFNAPVDGGVRPPAAGSISSSHAPHLVTESTYATSESLSLSESFHFNSAAAIVDVVISIIISASFCVNILCLHALFCALLIWLSSVLNILYLFIKV